MALPVNNQIADNLFDVILYYYSYGLGKKKDKWWAKEFLSLKKESQQINLLQKIFTKKANDTKSKLVLLTQHLLNSINRPSILEHLKMGPKEWDLTGTKLKN